MFIPGERKLLCNGFVYKPKLIPDYSNKKRSFLIIVWRNLFWLYNREVVEFRTD